MAGTLALEEVLGTSGVTPARRDWFAAPTPADVMIPYELPRVMFRGSSGASSEGVVLPLVSQGRVVSQAPEATLWASGQLRLYVAEILASQWEDKNRGRSSLGPAMRDPICIALRRLGDDALALAMRRLEGSHRPLWLRYLQTATDERPATGATSVEGAARAWRDWGRRRGLLG